MFKCAKCGKSQISPRHFLMEACDKVAFFFGRLAYWLDSGRWP